MFSSSLYEEFEDFLKIKYGEEYDTKPFENKQLNFEIIFKLGLDQARKLTEQRKSYDLLYCDKPPRADMVQKLGHILYELKEIPSFPIVPPLRVSSAVKKVLSSRDKRTISKYMKWIQSISNYNPSFNKLDLTHLYEMFPKSKIVKGGLW